VDFVARDPEAGEWSCMNMNKFSRDLVQGMNEAAEFAEGKKLGARVHVVDVPDVRAIRGQPRMSQQRFAETYRIPLPTLKNWEQGRRSPDAPAAAYPHAISRQPTAIKEALRHG
jgi:putative transcriptional regulator